MRVASVVAGLLLLGAALAPPLLGQAGQISYEAFTLPNGLRVIYSEDHSTPIVSVDVWYNTGSRNERPGRSGFAHLFEHMMFEGDRKSTRLNSSHGYISYAVFCLKK